MKLITKPNSKIILNATTEIKDKLKEKAKSMSLSLNQYCLFILTNTKVKLEVEDN